MCARVVKGSVLSTDEHFVRAGSNPVASNTSHRSPCGSVIIKRFNVYMLLIKVICLLVICHYQSYSPLGKMDGKSIILRYVLPFLSIEQTYLFKDILPANFYAKMIERAITQFGFDGKAIVELLAENSDNTILSGSFLLNLIMGRKATWNANDIDIFTNSLTFIEKLDKLIPTDKHQCPEFFDYANSLRCKINNILDWPSPIYYSGRKIQVIYTEKTTPAEVISKFDIYCCRSVFNGVELTISDETYKAIVTRKTPFICLFDTADQFTRVLMRTEKYKKRGFTIVYPNKVLLYSSRFEPYETLRKKIIENHRYYSSKGYGSHCEKCSSRKSYEDLSLEDLSPEVQAVLAKSIPPSPPCDIDFSSLEEYPFHEIDDLYMGYSECGDGCKHTHTIKCAKTYRCRHDYRRIHTDKCMKTYHCKHDCSKISRSCFVLRPDCPNVYDSTPAITSILGWYNTNLELFQDPASTEEYTFIHVLQDTVSNFSKQKLN